MEERVMAAPMVSIHPLGWPWEAQSSPRVARESWGLRSSSQAKDKAVCVSGLCVCVWTAVCVCVGGKCLLRP